MRGILMIEPLYNQVIKGNKTQTRRKGGLEAVNQRVEYVYDEDSDLPGGHKPIIVNSSDEWELMRFNNTHAKFIKKHDALCEVYCKPRYKVGEVLFIKEPYIEHDVTIGLDKDGNYITGTQFGYKYGSIDGHPITVDNLILPMVVEKFKNKLFMPASAARVFIKIRSIKCERLLDIKGVDCIAEGVETTGFISKSYGKENAWFTTDRHLQDSFISLYRFANKMSPKADVKNIFVWVYTFEYLKDFKP